MTDPKDDAPWFDTTYDGFDEEVLKIDNDSFGLL